MCVCRLGVAGQGLLELGLLFISLIFVLHFIKERGHKLGWTGGSCETTLRGFLYTNTNANTDTDALTHICTSTDRAMAILWMGCSAMIAVLAGSASQALVHANASVEQLVIIMSNQNTQYASFFFFSCLWLTASVLF